VGDVARDHGLAEALRRDEDDVARTVEELEAEGGFDGIAVEALGPGPVELGHRLESADAATGDAAFEAAAGSMLGFVIGVNYFCRLATTILAGPMGGQLG
jgi:hypothetical protein